MGDVLQNGGGRAEGWYGGPANFMGLLEPVALTQCIGRDFTLNNSNKSLKDHYVSSNGFQSALFQIMSLRFSALETVDFVFGVWLSH